ncbi:MAG: hypothetical protein IKM43_04140 [Clostridia bacterium]|nr:hypothetical protein [Clostridia bacterium]
MIDFIWYFRGIYDLAIKHKDTDSLYNIVLNLKTIIKDAKNPEDKKSIKNIIERVQLEKSIINNQ